MTRTTARFRLIAGLLLAGALVLTGCSNGSDDSAGSTSSSQSSSAGDSADFNEADVTFVQNMIPHHEGALEMAQLAADRAQDTRVKDLASRIESAQEPEIKTMTQWLENWGQPTAASESDDMGGMDMGEDSSSPSSGMDMDTSMLESASGAEFDRMFLQMMIQHHTSAVQMADTEISNGQNESAVSLAQQISDSQTAEIQEMQTLLTELGG